MPWKGKGTRDDSPEEKRLRGPRRAYPGRRHDGDRTGGARHNDEVWAGVAAGLAGGIIGGAIASQPRRVYVEPEYEYAPPPPPVYRRTYYRAAPPCHYEWVENEWGEAYRARVCY